MLDAHPEMAIPPESYFLPGLYRFRARYELPGGRFDYPRFAEDVVRTEQFGQWGLPREHVEEAFGSVGPGRVADAIRLLYLTYSESLGKPRYGDKTPPYLGQIQLLANALPEARFVHIVRDPRAVSLSYSSFSWGARDVVDGAVRWRDFVAAGREQGRTVGPERYLEVRYEDLVSWPERSLQRVAAFVGLDFDSAMLEYRDRALERIPEAERSQHGNVTLPPTTGLRDWRAQLSGPDLEAVEAAIGPLLEELGYERSVDEIGAEARARADRAERRWNAHRRRRRLRGRIRKRIASLRPGWRSPRQQ